MRQTFPLLLLVWLCACASSSPVTSALPQGFSAVADVDTDVVHEGTELYTSFADTLKPVARVPYEGKVVVVAYQPTGHWCIVKRSGRRYYTRLKYVRWLALQRSREMERLQERNAPAGQSIQTGPRGGRYYINKNGNKTYIKR